MANIYDMVSGRFVEQDDSSPHYVRQDDFHSPLMENALQLQLVEHQTTPKVVQIPADLALRAIFSD